MVAVSRARTESKQNDVPAASLESYSSKATGD